MVMKAKGLVSLNTHTLIDETISAIENFWRLNKSSRSYRRMAPLTSSEQPFMTFSELELIEFLGEEKRSKVAFKISFWEIITTKTLIPR